MKPCIICGKLTEWRCADYAINHIHSNHPIMKEKSDTAICERPECRDEHEKQLNHITV